jgi:hypothetical protein
MTVLWRYATFAAAIALGLAPLNWVVAVTLATLPGLAIVWIRPHSTPSWVGHRPMSRWTLEPSVVRRSIAWVRSTA